MLRVRPQWDRPEGGTPRATTHSMYAHCPRSKALHLLKQSRGKPGLLSRRGLYSRDAGRGPVERAGRFLRFGCNRLKSSYWAVRLRVRPYCCAKWFSARSSAATRHCFAICCYAGSP